ncbi:aconitate hydratase AcnA [Arthrobacter sp. YD2]|uniref:aconitate hydratase AcnA n=1 Tax=Arthrobacter sp. YD2 TaxID=3058046 RepID=UPI0025B2E0AC|nr:aconitate hydratase AcnA [Arthrobacter sp. YD2]MDN3905576.1 aconitate hydratase AcnA [Arthrobacter sp. YD2]
MLTTSFTASTGTLDLSTGPVRYVDITTVPGVEGLPLSLKILLENVLRHGAGPEAVAALMHSPSAGEGRQVPFHPARVVMQDMAGAPVIHDLVTLREAVARHGGDPAGVKPLIPAELVVDHSVIVDSSGNRSSFRRNAEREFERNEERFRFLRWAQDAFDGLKVVPPGRGIIHQVNIEHLTRGVMTTDADGERIAYPDSCIGTDSHTTMVNGLGVLGWGVGGIEAVSALLGHPLSMLVPPVVGVEFTGSLRPGTTATDLVLRITELLRGHGVVGKIVEFHGAGLAGIPVADRATIANMSPEFGSTAAMFPVDAKTVEYYTLTGRPREQVELIEAYARAQGMWSDGGSSPAHYSESLRLDLSEVVPSIAGPYRPQDRISLDAAHDRFRGDLAALLDRDSEGDSDGSTGSRRSTTDGVDVTVNGANVRLRHGALAIAAITSCTNTSNPHVMMTAALLARNAVRHGLRVPPWVKTSLAPGSQVVTRYLEQAGLMPDLETLGFHVVGYGCTTCMGNSGPLADPVSDAAQDVVLTSVLSGNRNFEGRISPDVRMNYLASPPLVISYALAGTMDIDLHRDPLGQDKDGRAIHLADLWPSPQEVEEELARAVTGALYRDTYAEAFAGTAQWEGMAIPAGPSYEFGESTYMRPSPFLDGAGLQPEPVADLAGARVLLKLGDSVTTDHISPVGHIRADSPAGQYLLAQGVPRRDFNTYGSRRGNHDVMVRGTFANVRLRNELANGRSGGFTQFLPSGEEMTVFDAAEGYRRQGVPLLVLGGREYGSGSARDYAAKGTYLLGVRAVLAESFERIHRSNLVGMGVIPLQFRSGDSAEVRGLDGTEEYSVSGLSGFSDGGWPRTAGVEARRQDGTRVMFDVDIRVDTATEAGYIRHGGILPFAFRAGLAA